MNSNFKKFLSLIFGFNQNATYPINWEDYTKDKACEVYMREFPLDNELCNIREQIEQDLLIKVLWKPIEATDEIKNIIYSCLEQKLNDLVDDYNSELLQMEERSLPFNPNRARDDAGHKNSDF